MTNVRTLEESLVRTLRAASFFGASPQVAIFSANEYTLDQMANALAAASTGILVEPEEFSGPNSNVPGAAGRISWTVRVVLNPISSMSGHMHPLDVALAAYNALHLATPKDSNGTAISGGQWLCTGIKCEAGEFRGNYVRTAVFNVSASMSTPRNSRP
jgi:hypothetical protein